LGFCYPVGTSDSYGFPETYEPNINHYVSDKPYIDAETLNSDYEIIGGPNGLLDPIDLVEDANDNGYLDTYTDGKKKPTMPSGF